MPFFREQAKSFKSFCPYQKSWFGLGHWLCSQRNESRSKDVSDCDPLRDWDLALNYVRSHALQMPSHSRSGSAHCEVIYFVPTVHSALIDPCMASARDSNMHTNESHSERALHSHVLETGFLCGSRSKTAFFSRFKSLIWKNFAFTKGKLRLSNQERAESRSETSFGTWFVL